MAVINKTSPYGLRDNPTGIYAEQGDDIILFVGKTDGVSPSLIIQDLNNKLSGVSYSLSTGLNKIRATNSGLMYIIYYTQTGAEIPVKINIASGTVNGFLIVRNIKKRIGRNS